MRKGEIFCGMLEINYARPSAPRCREDRRTSARTREGRVGETVEILWVGQSILPCLDSDSPAIPGREYGGGT